jgi:hypothetical protein
MCQSGNRSSQSFHFGTLSSAICLNLICLLSYNIDSLLCLFVCASRLVRIFLLIATRIDEHFLTDTTATRRRTATRHCTTHIDEFAFQCYDTPSSFAADANCSGASDRIDNESVA